MYGHNMSFVKLDCGMLDSTIWPDRDAREMFITALLMARPHLVNEPTPQINVRSLEVTGFVVQPGWYGFVSASGDGIARRAGMDKNMESAISALERLGAPEMGSRTPDFDGRRMVRVSGGYIVLNFYRYRDKDHTAAERSKKYRENKKKKSGKSRRFAPGPISGELAYSKAESNGASQEQLDSIVSASLPSPWRKSGPV